MNNEIDDLIGDDTKIVFNQSVVNVDEFINKDEKEGIEGVIVDLDYGDPKAIGEFIKANNLRKTENTVSKNDTLLKRGTLSDGSEVYIDDENYRVKVSDPVKDER